MGMSDEECGNLLYYGIALKSCLAGAFASVYCVCCACVDEHGNRDSAAHTDEDNGRLSNCTPLGDLDYKRVKSSLHAFEDLLSCF